MKEMTVNVEIKDVLLDKYTVKKWTGLDSFQIELTDLCTKRTCVLGAKY